MPVRAFLAPRSLGLALAMLAAAPAASWAQQNQNVPVLPPPSLDDAPMPQPAPVPQEPAPRASATPAPSTSSSPTPVPVKPAPVAKSSEPAAAPAATSATDEARPPWYKRWWNSLFGGGSESTRSEPEPAKPAMAPPATPAPAAPANNGYAGDTERTTIRTGATGQCVKTGEWDKGDMTGACGGQSRVARSEPAKPAPPPAPKTEPVEVQPLTAPPLKEEKRLEAEAPPAPVEPALQAAPPPEPVAKPAPPPEPPPVKLATLSADALFALNQYQLKPGARKALDDLAAKLAGMQYSSIKVTGHTDPTGTAKYNDRLSRERAGAVKKYLVSKGVPANKIQAEGVGSSMPMVIEKDCASLPKKQMIACYQPDRRVDVDVSGLQPKMAKQ